VSSDKPKGMATFTFIGFWVDSLTFQEVARAPLEAGDERPPSPGCNMTLGANAGIDPGALQGQITMQATFQPDPKWQPYKLDLKVTGRFGVKDGTAEDLDTFIRVNAPAVLFPYMREIVHRTTKDGQFGVIRVDPINVAAMFSGAWTQLEPKTP
jgi:preprotein translocase subunit SecB